MNNTSWLEKAIHESAVKTFESKYNADAGVNEEVRLVYQKLSNTDEFQMLKNALVKYYEQVKTQEVLSQLSGVKDLFDAQS